MIRRCFDVGGPRTCRLCCEMDQLEGGDLKVWGDPTAICISAPCTQSMPCIGHFAEVGGFLAGGCSTSRNLLHLSSPLFVWLKMDFCNFFQLMPSSPFERDFQRVPTPHLALPITVSLHFLGSVIVHVTASKRLTVRTSFDTQSAILCQRNLVNGDCSFRKTNKTIFSSCPLNLGARVPTQRQP